MGPFEAWAIIKEGGPYAVAAVLFIMWWRAEARADKERGINEERTNRLYDLGITMRDATVQFNNTLDKALDVIRRAQ